MNITKFSAIFDDEGCCEIYRLQNIACFDFSFTGVGDNQHTVRPQRVQRIDDLGAGKGFLMQ
ncbi:hypothetical protein OAT72_02835 [Alphaproteobacteria bacterium]|nr:hypothetical protein [Alphaproteobacteria bacterium]